MAGNLRRNVASVGALSVGFLTIALIFLREAEAPVAEPSRGTEGSVAPLQLVISRTDATHCANAEDIRQPQLMAAIRLRLLTLSERGLAHLLEVLEQVVDGLTAEALPFAVNLEESPELVLRRELPWLLPSWTASREVVQLEFCSASMGLRVSAPQSVTLGSEEVLALMPFPELGPAFDSQQRQARLLAWPITESQWLTLDKPSNVQALRRRAERGDSSIALVLDKDTLSTDALRTLALSWPRIRALALQLKQLGGLVGSPPSGLDRMTIQVVQALLELSPAESAAPSEPPLLPWLRLDAGQVFIVPRLSAVGRRARVMGEARAVVAISQGTATSGAGGGTVVRPAPAR